MADTILVPLADNPVGGRKPLEWSLALWGDNNPWFTAEQWHTFYIDAAQADYCTWDPAGQDQELIYLAQVEGEVVGAIALVDFDDVEEFREFKPWVAAFIVDPERRGEGIGSEMLASIEDKARELGIRQLYLWTEDQKNFYIKRGYSLVAHRDYPTKSIDVLRKKI